MIHDIQLVWIHLSLVVLFLLCVPFNSDPHPPVNTKGEQDGDDGEQGSWLKVVATPEPDESRRGNVLKQAQIGV